MTAVISRQLVDKITKEQIHFIQTLMHEPCLHVVFGLTCPLLVRAHLDSFNCDKKLFFLLREVS